MAKDQNDGAYFSRYGFESDPFEGSYQPANYYVSAELQHRLELLKHLLEFSQQILFVKGPVRAGKSAFLDHLVASLEENWVVSRVSAETLEGPDSLIRAIIGSTQNEISGDGETISALNRYLSYCDNRSLMPVVVIDDADQLSKSSLGFLFQLINFKDQETYIRVVILGEEKVAGELNTIASENSASDVIHAINLPAFTLEQTIEFLAQRLGGEQRRAELIPDKEAQRIHKVSAGVVGDIMFLARQGLINPALDRVSSGKKEPDTGSSKPITFMTILLPAVLLAVAMSYFFLGAEKTESADEPKTVALELPRPEQKPAAMPVAVPAQAKQEEPPDSWMEQNEEHLAKLEKGIEEARQLPMPVEVKESAETAKPVTESEPVEQVPPPIKPAEQLPVAQQEQAEPLIPGLRDQDWLASQDNGDYVLQLLRAVEKNTVSNFIAETGLDKQALSVYESRKDGKTWYVLVHGLFQDIDSARQAVSSLPEGARSARPWPKQIAAIRAELGG